MGDLIFDLAVSAAAVTDQNAASYLRSRDTAQREALARVEAERDEAREFMRINAKSGMQYAEQRDALKAQLAEAVGLLRKIMDGDWQLQKVAVLLDRITSQAEQQEAPKREWTFHDLPNVPTSQLPREEEAQGAQAGYRRAALATQPAAGGPVDGVEGFACWLIDHCEGYEIFEEKIQEWVAGYLKSEAYQRVAAPPAAAHGDEAGRKDAERYRWVREPSNGNKVWAMITDGECGRNMDAAIDAAMRAQGDGE